MVSGHGNGRGHGHGRGVRETGRRSTYVGTHETPVSLVPLERVVTSHTPLRVF